MRLLIVEDHILLGEGYRQVLEEIVPKSELVIDEVRDCQSAYEILHKRDRKYDLILLDLNLPPYYSKNLESGEDLIPLIKEFHKGSKLLVVTSHSKSIILYDLLRIHQPHGLLVKSDVSREELRVAIEHVMNGAEFRSDAVTHAMELIRSQDGYLDFHNRQIITLIAKGIKTKSMTKYLPLSTSAIDKRKAQIKDYFLISSGSDEDILREARKIGLI